MKSASYTCTPVGVGGTKNCQLVRRLQRIRDPSMFPLRLCVRELMHLMIGRRGPLGMHRFAILGQYFLIQQRG